jgi:putative aldouronate transport system permease protein
VILTFCFLVVAYPLYFIVIASISDPVDVYAGKVFLYPVHASLDGYRRILEYKSFFTGYRNTAVYTVVGTLVNVVMTIPAAYALSRKDLVGRNAVMMMITFTMLFSGGMIPSYLLVNDLGIDNTMWALILPGAVSSWNLIVARTFFQQTIPDELLEAAQLDGASKVKQIMLITVPMLKSTVITLTLMSIGRIFYSDFGLFYQVPQNSGRLFDVTQTIDTYVYRGLMELNDVGMSAAAALYQSLVGFILVVAANALVRKIDSENALF